MLAFRVKKAYNVKKFFTCKGSEKVKIREKIKYFIALSGKNQVQIAKKLDCSRYTVQMRIAQGTNIVKMLEILNACDCDMFIKHRKTGTEMMITADDFKEDEGEKK